MNRKLCIALTLLAGTTGAVATPSASAQKGALGVGADPSAGILAPDGGHRYTSLSAGEGTLVTEISTTGGRLEQSTYLDGHWAVPAVAYDGSASGVSGNGRTLVLSKPGARFPQPASEFAVLDTDRLRVLDRVTLDGTFTFDALSPNGRWMYLVEYTSRRDPIEYRVRSYDLRRDRLDPTPILDPDESAEEMYGTPVTRATDRSGRWAYTLYDGTEHPFIHALDTKRGTAVCIDLDSLESRQIYRYDLQPSGDGSTLAVIDRREPVATVDLGTFEVSDPAPPAPQSATATATDDGGSEWVVIVPAAVLVLVAGAAILIRGRHRPAGEDELERLVRVDEPEPIEEPAEDERETRECEPVP